ncbi:MAG: methylmalonyl-CoA mutase [Deltaproteobacteria bacterium]|nr:methylmalonyl-CoA mutase [Deltaproteobacteria bacterium]
MGNVRIVIGMMGMDQHEVGAIAVSRILMEAGMEVIYLGRFQSPASIVNAGIDEAADIIGISCHSWEYLYFLPDIISLLKAQQINIPIIVGGSVITGGDREKLLEMGVAAVFEAGAGKDEIVQKVGELAAQGIP